MSDEKEIKPLSAKHQMFVNEYLKLWNATRAYMVAYPTATEESARSLGAQLLANVSIKAALQLKLNESHMSADEALKLLAEIAHGKEPAKRVVTSSSLGDTETVTYDPMGALDKILRVHGKYQDNLEVKLPEKITVRLVKDDAN